MADCNVDLTTQTQEARLAELLSRLDFDRKYYGYVAAHAQAARESALPREVVAEAVEKLPLAFKYQRGEKLFRHREKVGKLELGLHLIIHTDDVEAVLVFKTDLGHLGEPFHVHARSVAGARDPSFEWFPAYPRLRFASAEGLAEALAFAVVLYEEIKAAVLAERTLFE